MKQNKEKGIHSSLYQGTTSATDICNRGQKSLNGMAKLTIQEVNLLAMFIIQLGNHTTKRNAPNRRPSISTHGTEPSQANPPPLHTPRGIPPTESTQTTPMQILRGLRNAEIGRAHKERRHHGEPTVRPASRRGEGGGGGGRGGIGLPRAPHGFAGAGDSARDWEESLEDEQGRGGGVLSCLRRMRFWFWNLLDPARFEIDGLRLTAMTPSVWKMRYLTERTSTHREVTERSLRNRERKGPRRKIYYDLVCFGGSIFVVSYQ